MDFDEVVLAAQEQVITDLVSGQHFKGLGATAKQLVMAAAHYADQNAKALHGDKTARTWEDYTKLSEDCQKQFVMDVLGFGHAPAMTPQAAAARLVGKVYQQYLNWAGEPQEV